MERTNFYDAVYSPVILILNAVVVAAVMLLSASGNKMVLTFFGMSAGTAVAVINYISQIFTPVESLGMEIQTIQSAIAGVHRINEFFGLEERTKGTEYNSEYPKTTLIPKTTPNAETTKTPEIPPYVQFKNVTFTYTPASDHATLENLSFSVSEGEQVTLSGRTGAGKSTIFKLLLGLYEPQYGQVLISGMPSAHIPDTERRHIFGYVEQSFHMIEGTVKDQITLYDTSIQMDAVQKAASMVGLDTVIEHLEQGYDTPCTPELFSQGQWQLLSIARATVADPKLLLLDEITASMDVQTEQEVLQALQRSATGRTVISISHRMNAKMGRVITIS